MNILLKSLTITLSLVASLEAMDDQYPVEIKHKILTEVVKDNYVKLDLTNFIESARPLRTVCEQWSQIINNNFVRNAMHLGCQQICPKFYNGTLIFRPKAGSDEGMMELKISGLWNPQGGTFNLSQCKILDKDGIERGNAGQLLSISTGYRKEKKAENINKLEIWFPLRFLVEKELGTTAGHLKVIFPSKWPESAEVGMLCTCGGNDNMDWYDYLTTENTVNLSKSNLYENWQKTLVASPRVVWKDGGGLRTLGAVEGCFQVLFVN